MLSGIKLVSKQEAERLDAEDRKHRHKKDKHKHKKKHKKDRKQRSDNSEDSDSGFDAPERAKLPSKEGGGEPVTAAAAADEDHQPAAQQREDWMTVPMARSTVPPPSTTNASNDQAEKEEDLKISKARELNPYLQSSDSTVVNPSAGGTHRSVGDGGASWRMKALRRSQAQAGEEGRALSDVVTERWGSLSALTADLSQQRAAHGMAHMHAARDRRGHEPEAKPRSGNHHHDKKKNNTRERGGAFNRERGDRERYLSDVKSARSQMRRPSEGNLQESMSWRRESGGGNGGRQNRSRADVDGGTNKSGERRDERRQREAATEVGEILKAAAPELNSFFNDGSFLKQFETQHQQQQLEEQQPSTEKDGNGDDGGGEIEEDGDNNPRNRQREQQQPVQPSNKREERIEQQQQQHITTNPNLSAAAALRARLGGRALPSTAATTTAPPQQHRTEERKEKKEEVSVHLPLIDAAGRAAPGAFGRESAASAAGGGGARPSKRVERFDKESGERKRYFADDDNVDLETLVKRTKFGGTEDIDSTMARNISRRSNFKESDLDADAEYDWDGGIDLADGQHKASKEARRRGSAKEEITQKEKQRQIREYTKFQSALDRCPLCFTSQSRRKHLTLAIGTAAYLALPPRGRLVPGHCQIIAADHIASTRISDETTWTEMRNFKKCLLQMFAAQGMDCIFVETAARAAGDVRAHAVVDCVPVPADVFAKAPMYFRKAIDDATSEWAQHAAKRQIDTSVKGLRGSIPPNFPYFHVEFGLGAGFVHVIDTPEEFDRELGRSVLVGLLRLPQEDMHRRAKAESQAAQVQWATEFRSQFDEFDWTKEL